MPDKNKLLKMKERGYQVAASCGVCAFRDRSGEGYWADCTHADAVYIHSEHNDARRLPSHLGLVCEDFEVDPQAVESLGLHFSAPKFREVL